ncbi:MAG: hypothetical protein ACFFDW_07175 [Candidatus Thorarchaeota archaeon]
MKRNNSRFIKFIFISFLLFLSINFEIASNDNKITGTISTPKIVQNNVQNISLKSSKTSDFIGNGPITIHSLELVNNFVLKGENAHLILEIESIENLVDISLEITFVSIESEYGLAYIQEKNEQIAPLILKATYEDYCSSLHAYENHIGYLSIGPLIDENATFKSAILPLNRGSWKITHLAFNYASGQSEYTLEDEIMIHVIFNPYQHVIFAYFIHNMVTPFNDGKTIRDSLNAGLERLVNDYSFSVNIIVIQEDDTWNPDESLLNCSDFITDACKHIGEKLDLKNDTWDAIVEYDLETNVWTKTKNSNGGYDIFIAASNRLCDTLGKASYGGNFAYAGSGRYDLLNYRISENQYDNLLQHEISHIFCANNRDGSNSIMDTSLSFNGTHFTSPCLELLNYVSIDLTYIHKHAGRFDGPPNPALPLSYGKETLLSSTENIFWAHPKLAIPKNSSYQVKYIIASLKNSAGKVSLYYDIYQENSWDNFKLLETTDQNITDYDLFADNFGNLHVVWIAQNLTDDLRTIFYKKYSYTGSWGTTEQITNGTNCYGLSISGDKSGKIHLVYDLVNESSSAIYYAIKESSWTKFQLPNSAVNSTLPKVSIDDYNNIHFLWIENSTSTNQLKLMYQMLTNQSIYDFLEEIFNISNHNYLINPQLTCNTESSLIAIKWEVISESQSYIYYIERYSSDNFSEIEIIQTKNELQSFNSQLLVTANEQIHIWWEQPNKWNNKSYLLFRNKIPNGSWHFTNGYTTPEFNYYNIALANGQDNTLQIVYIKTDLLFQTTTKYCRLFTRILYPVNHQITIGNFTFEASLVTHLYIEFSQINALSSFSSIGYIDSPSEALYNGFGIWRNDDGLPLHTGTLTLDSISGNWSGSGIIDNPKPGIYFVGVNFRDKNGISSGNVYSKNTFIIIAPEDSNNPENSLGLILGLSIGIPIFVIGVTSPIVIILVKRRRIDK